MALNNIDDNLLDLLINRLHYWTSDNIKIELFTKMYRQYIDEGVFNNIALSISKIVDNDYVNNYDTVHKNDIEKYNNCTIECSTDDNEFYLVRNY